MTSRRWISGSALMLCAVSVLSAVGCQNYRDQLQRGQGYYEKSQYEAALAVWRNLEPEQGALTTPEVVRYCYLRGMTDYRLGYKSHARYWLGLARASLDRAQATGESAATALAQDESERLKETLKELNDEVYGLSGPKGSSEDALGDACKFTTDCDAGFTCQEGMCIQVEDSAGASVPDGAAEKTAVPPKAATEAE